MKIHFVFLLMCAAMCASRPLDPRCGCVKTDKSVKPTLILSIREIKPNSYCNKMEVILTLKDKRKVCIDPNGEFYHFLVKQKKKLAQIRAKKNSITTTEPAAQYSTTSTLQALSPSGYFKTEVV